MRTCCLAGFVLSGLLTGSAFAGTVADTGFEVSDSYPNPLDPNNGLGGYYDLHDLDGAGGRPFADPGDVLGWGTNTWAGLGHGVSTTYVERNQPGKLSFEGDQYAVMRPPSPSSDLYVRRKFNPGVFNTTMRAMVSFAIRVDTPLSTAPYFSGNNPAFMLEYKPDGNPDTGDKEVNIELEADGDLVAKRGNLANGADITVGKWDGSGALASALNGWVSVQLAANLDSETYFLIWNGTYIGQYKFRSTLKTTPPQEMNQLRFTGGKWAAGQGLSIDSIMVRDDFQGLALPCLSDVTPGGATALEAWIDQPITQPVEFTVASLGTGPLDYTAVELDDTQAAADVPWLNLSGAPGTIPGGTTQAVTATVSTAGLTPGLYTAYVRIADGCSPSAAHVRRIDVNVRGCQWTVDSCNQVRSYLLDYPNMPVADVVYRITNTGHLPMTYTVTTSGSSCLPGMWTLSGDSGEIAAGGFADVRAAFNPAALAGQTTDDSYSCDLLFTDGCSTQTITRTVRLRYMGVGETPIFRYNGDIDPLIDGSAGEGLRFDLYRETGLTHKGAVEADDEALDGSVWRLQDGSDTKTKYRVILNGGTLEVASEIGATILARVKVREQSGSQDGGLFIWEEDAGTCTYHWGGPTGVVMEKQHGTTAGVTPSEKFVTLRMTCVGRKDDPWDCGRIVRLYLNENPTPVIELIGDSEKSSIYEGIGFGAGSTSGTYDIAFDWINGTTAGAFAPGEEEAVLGISLNGNGCPSNWADFDQDQDVDQADFAWYQRCFTGAGDLGGQFDVVACRCADRNGDEDVDADDVAGFALCATGPGVAFDPQNPPVGCQ